MRYLIYLLVLANLGLFAWLYTHRDEYRSSAPASTTLPSSLEPLILLRERGGGEALQVPVEPVPKPEPEPEPGAVVTMTPPSAADPATTATTAAVTDDSLPVAEPVSAPEPPPETAPAATQIAAPPVLAEPPAPLPRVCQTIGPFAARNDAQAFMDRLSLLAEPPVMRTAQIEEPSGYWVYLSAMPRDQANRTIDDLAAKGVKDYFLGRQNVISLGIFSDKRMAENRVRDIGRLGYQPRLEPRFATREVYWVDFEERGPEYLSAEQWRELLGGQAELRRQSLTCE